MSHRRDSIIDTLNLPKHSRQVLQHQASRCSRMLAVEFFDIMTKTSAHIDQQHCVLIGASSLVQQVLNWIEVRIHPTGATLTVRTHVVVELREYRLMIANPGEVVLGRVERILEGTITRVCGIHVCRPREIFRKLIEGWHHGVSTGVR